MHSRFRSSYRLGRVGYVIWMLLGGCGQKADEGTRRATREECQQVAEHAADLIMETATTHPNEFWDLLHLSEGESGIPQDLKKEEFETWLETDQGRTWMMKRRGQTLAGTQQGVEPCVAAATKRDIKCFLASKTKDELAACDLRGSAGAGALGSGSGSGSAGSGAPGSGGSGSGSAGSAAGSGGSGSGTATPGNGSAAANDSSGSGSAKAP